jgi:hypothetical protein
MLVGTSGNNKKLLKRGGFNVQDLKAKTVLEAVSAKEDINKPLT